MDIKKLLALYRDVLALQKMTAEYKEHFIEYGLWNNFQEAEILKIPETEKMVLCLSEIKEKQDG